MIASLALLIKVFDYSRLAWFLNIISESRPNLSINKTTMVSKVIKRDCSKSEPIGWIESRLLLFCSLGDGADILIILEACFASVDKSSIVKRTILTLSFLAFSVIDSMLCISPWIIASTSSLLSLFWIKKKRLNCRIWNLHINIIIFIFRLLKYCWDYWSISRNYSVMRFWHLIFNYFVKFF